MNSRRANFTVLCCSAGLLALGQARAVQDDAAELASARREFVAAINAAGPERVGGSLAPGVVFLVHNQPPLEGREAFLDLFQKIRASGVRSEFEMETTRLEISGDLAYELGRYHIVRHLPDGSVREIHGKYVDVWKRQLDGRWRLVAHAPSNNPPE